MTAIFGRACGAFFLFFAGACAGMGTPETAPPVAASDAAAQAAAAGDAAARIEADVRWLADDAREGREAGSRGYRQAADYVAARMAGMGLTPAGVDGWFQDARLLSARPVLDASAMSVTGPDGRTRTLKHLDDFRVFPSLEASEFDITAPAVFVGYGVHAPEMGYDDYAGLDAAGKIVVAFNGAPNSLDSEHRAHFGNRSVKQDAAAAHGAIGIISLYTAAAEERFPWERFIANPQYAAMTWLWPDGRADVSGPGLKGRATLNPESSEILFQGAPKSYADVRAEADAEGGAPKGFDLAVTVTMAGAIEREEVSSPNVIGVIPGADQVLKNEYVVLTAHLDHIGINERLAAEGKDGVNNGAMDNALGVAVMLESARRLLQGERPARSILIVAVTGEEKGLLGSDYFAHFPTVPKDALVADINLDMPVMLYSFTDIVAYGGERSTLGDNVRAAAAKMGVDVSPDPVPQLGIFTRSDHYRFVEQGVPSIFLWPGLANGGEQKFDDFMKNHYHQPSDDASLPILYEDVARFAELNVLIAREVANAPERPRWNEGDFFGDLFGGGR